MISHCQGGCYKCPWDSEAEGRMKVSNKLFATTALNADLSGLRSANVFASRRRACQRQGL
eukprot:2067323-Pleurochrysis_carterae.AAC.1